MDYAAGISKVLDAQIPKSTIVGLENMPGSEGTHRQQSTGICLLVLQLSCDAARYKCIMLLNFG